MQQLCKQLQLDEYVEFSGYLEGDALYELLATADVGVCPDPKNSFNDKLSMNKILEYMAFGLPVVQFDLNEGRFIAEEAALYATENDPVNFAGAIVKLLDDPKARAAMREIGRARVRELFSWEKQEQRYLQTYRTLLTRATSGAGSSSIAKPIFGFWPTSGSLHRVVDTILEQVRTPGEGVGLVVTPNIHHVAQLRTDEDFRQAYRSAAMVLCDGWPVYSYARKGGHEVSLVTGCDLISELFDHLPQMSRHRVCLLLDSVETERAVNEWGRQNGLSSSLITMVPPIGFLRDQSWCRGATKAISEFQPTILILGVGAPQSEIFIDRLRSALPPCWALCIGQAVKVKLGLVRRAPAMVRWLRAEWLWRVLSEPRRLAPRYLSASRGFLASLLDDLRGVAPKRNLGPPPEKPEHT
jgi:N-acetylglucosaminyldiphosphoundecaprenol N-acetyl-beta-D-mannosaminyltransferase